MAIRERKGRATPWQVYWNNPFTGKRECAHFATKEEALKEDSRVKLRLKFERESFRPQEKNEQEEVKEMTLEQAYFLYLREKQFNKKNLSCQLTDMKTALQLHGLTPLSEIGRKEIEHILAELGKRPLKQVTLHGRMVVLKAVLNWCAEKGFCQPISFPKMTKGHYEKFIPPSPNELRLMLASAQPHIQRVILLGSQCGIRVGSSELFKLTWSDVDFELGIIRVKAAQKNPSAPWREIPMRQSLKEHMRKWYEHDLLQGIFYIINYRGKAVTNIKGSWMNMLQKAGITRRIRPYDLRHAFATELIAAGTDIGTVAKLMGHSSPNMIYQHYQYVLDKQKIAAVEALPEIEYVPKNMCPNEKRVTESR